MSDERKLYLGLPPGVTIKVYPLDAAEVREMVAQYPNLAGKIDGIAVISGLSARELRNSSTEIQKAVWDLYQEVQDAGT